MRAHLSALTLALAISTGLTGAVLAHAHLVSAEPAVNDAVVEAPGELDLHFSESIDLSFSGVTIADEDQKPVATGTAKLAEDDKATLIVPITDTLKSGTYTVNWHALASDGHKSNGTYTFTVK
jgi:methionine-rich copper-binding protein CopC